MILAETTEERMVPLQKLLELQRSDFIGILKAMDGLPVTIRLLDPPLHEFLPEPHEAAKELEQAKRNGAPAEEIERLERLYEGLCSSRNTTP